MKCPNGCGSLKAKDKRERGDVASRVYDCPKCLGRFYTVEAFREKMKPGHHHQTVQSSFERGVQEKALEVVKAKIMAALNAVEI